MRSQVSAGCGFALAIALAGCGGGGGGSTSTTTPVEVAKPKPTVSLTSSKPLIRINKNESATLTWSSSNATACTASGAWSGNQASSGNATAMPNTSGKHIYKLTCTGDGGSAEASVEIIAPIPVQATSYLNAKNLNIPSQLVPSFPTSTNEHITGGLAFADFFQEGQISMVGFTNKGSGDPTKPNPAGTIHFYRKVDGAWVDKTATLLSDATGCEAPRKLLVVDFNGDNRPDVFASCHGNEFGPAESWKGEAPRLLLSQSDGTYKNVVAPTTCYCHGSTAGDINGDGKPDIIVSDALLSVRQVYALINNGDGTFTVDKSKRLPDSIWPISWNGQMEMSGAFSVELIDVNNDSILDLVLPFATNSYHTNRSNGAIIYGNGVGQFVSPTMLKLDETVWGTIDIVVKGGNLYQYMPSSDYKSFSVKKTVLSTMESTVIYKSSDKVWRFGNSDFIWMMPYNDALVPYDAGYDGVTIKM